MSHGNDWCPECERNHLGGTDSEGCPPHWLAQAKARRAGLESPSGAPAAKPPPPVCPYCQGPLEVLLFMGVQPDGFTCPKCSVFFSPAMKALGTIY